MRLSGLGLIAVLALGGGELAAAEPTVAVTLKPLSADGEIRRVEVTQVVTGLTPGQAALAVPARVTTISGQPYAEGDMAAADADGPLPLKMAVEEAPPGYPLQWRTFTPQRAPRGPITLKYAADVAPALSPRKPGPSYDLRGVDGGFGGAFFSFLLLPRTDEPTRFQLSWDLPPGARGVSTEGEGPSDTVMPTMGINTVFFLAGKVQGHAAPGGKFRAYWIGEPPFDAKAAAAWSETSFGVLERFFQAERTKPYTLLMRPFARPRDGGAATRGGFMLEYGRGEMSDAARRIMFTHEMVHHFVGSLDGDTGANAWFGEGLAEFYKVRLPLRAGLITPAQAAREIGVMTQAYYNAGVIDVPFAELGKRRWADSSAQSAPYNRGFVYFADLDAAVRAKSGGARSLDDLVLAMLQSRRAGQGYDEALWRRLLAAELGEAGPRGLDAMLAGRLIVPPEGAFGPCLARRELRHPRQVLGFSEDAFLMQPAVVSGLQAGSAAEAAGLRDGDEVLSFRGVTPRIAHSASNVQLAPRVEMSVRRAGEARTISFSTDGPQVVEYAWALRPGAETCAL